jgi:hypothetical protein
MFAAKVHPSPSHRAVVSCRAWIIPIGSDFALMSAIVMLRTAEVPK